MAKFTGKHLCSSVFFNKVPRGLRSAILLKKEIPAQLFPCEFCKILNTEQLIEHCFLYNNSGGCFLFLSENKIKEHLAMISNKDLYKKLLYKRYIKRQTGETSSDNEWQRMVQRVTTNDNEWFNKWQRMTTSDREWQRVVQQMKTNENK